MCSGASLPGIGSGGNNPARQSRRLYTLTDASFTNQASQRNTDEIRRADFDTASFGDPNALTDSIGAVLRDHITHGIGHAYGYSPADGHSNGHRRGYSSPHPNEHGDNDFRADLHARHFDTGAKLHPHTGTRNLHSNRQRDIY